MRTEDNKRPTLVEPDSDDDTMPPRKRQKSERLPVSAGSSEGLALLQTAFEVVLAADKKAFASSVKAASMLSTADRSSLLWGIPPSLLPRGGVWPDNVSTPRPSIMAVSSSSAASAASIMSRRAANKQDIEMLLSLAVLNKRRSQQVVVGTTNRDLSTSPTKARAGPPSAAPPPLPSGRPLLAPPRLPHLLKLGLNARNSIKEC